jgi:hypothetical protein
MGDTEDTLHSTQAERSGGTHTVGADFAEGPSRAEATQGQTRRTQPLWPWAIVAALVVLGFVLWAALS